MYITKEVEVWIDESDLDGWDGFLGTETTHDLIPFIEALEALHEEHHGGCIWVCPHPACYSVRGSMPTVREVRNKYEHPSLLAIHAAGARQRDQQARASGVYTFRRKER